MLTISLLLMLGAAFVAAAVAFVYNTRTRSPASINVMGDMPTHLDRSDFRAPDADWLVVVFSSQTCSSCAAVWAEVGGLDSSSTATQNVEVTADAALHERYRVESVPLTVVADQAGAVVFGFFGPVGPTERSRMAAILDGDD